MTDIRDPLSQAIEEAIDAGRAELDRLDNDIKKALDSLESMNSLLRPLLERLPASRHGGPEHLQESISELFGQYSALLQDRRTWIRDFFAAQRESLGSFHVPLYARTGTGKTSLIEALTRGDGEPISPGISDWTDNARFVQWQRCVLVDTPGIDGPGRKLPREELERRACRQVKIADIVCLLFDTQNQLASEFDKIASTIVAYGKPVIAVLNCKNPIWRMLPRVPDARSRRALSLTVRQHVAHIRSQLERIGLPNIPIVVIMAKRAVFARAKEPFRGPQEDRGPFLVQRAKYGTENLAAWSNLPALEELLITALRQDASGLRLSMLREEVRRILTMFGDNLADLAKQFLFYRDQYEIFLGTIFNVVGYPPPGSPARQILEDTSFGGNLLDILERMRGEEFTSRQRGEVLDHAEHLVTAHLRPLRTAALLRAEEAVVRAFDQQKQLSAIDFSRLVLNPTEQTKTAQAARTILAEAQQLLINKLQSRVRSFQADLELSAMVLPGVDGTAGSNLKTRSSWLQLGGLVLDFLLQTSASDSLLGKAASALMRVFGRRSQEQAEQIRLKQRHNTIVRTRQDIHAHFDSIEKEIITRIRQFQQEHTMAALTEAVRVALGCRITHDFLIRWRRLLMEIVHGLPPAKQPVKIFERAARTVERQHFPNDPPSVAAAKVWLGEDWIDEPALAATEETHHQVSQPVPDPVLVQRLRRQVERCLSGPGPAAGRRWLTLARQRLGGDQEARPLVAEIQALQRSGKIRIQPCGDYNAGKTSFCKRVLVELGLRGEGLVIRADPTTTTLNYHEAGQVLLCDSPGFQSGVPSHAEIALRSLADAAIVFHLFLPDSVRGRTDALEAVMSGSADGNPSKLPRTIAIINQIDILGTDPLESPAHHLRLCQDKIQELVLSLHDRGISLSVDSVFCMSTDPFGLNHERSDIDAGVFDASRSWDGFGALAQVLLELPRSFVDVAVSISVLEGGAARLVQLAATQRARLAKIHQQTEGLERLREAMNDARLELDILGQSLHDQIIRLVDDHTGGLRQEALLAGNRSQIEEAHRRMVRWWLDKDFLAPNA